MPKIVVLTKFIYLSASTTIRPSPHLMTADFHVSEADWSIRPVKFWLTSNYQLSCTREAIAAGRPPARICPQSVGQHKQSEMRAVKRNHQTGSESTFNGNSNNYRNPT